MITFKNLFKLISEGYKTQVKRIKLNNSFSPEYKNRLISQINKHRKLKDNHKLPSQLLQIDSVVKKYGYDKFIELMDDFPDEMLVTRDTIKNNIIDNNEFYTTYKINNYTECEKIARGADWCISRSPGDHTDGENAFKKYIKDQNAELYISRANGWLNYKSIDIRPIINNFIAFIYLPYNNEWAIFNNADVEIISHFELDILRDKGVPVDKIFSLHPNSKLRTTPYILNLNA